MFSTVRWRLIWIGVLAAMCAWALVPKEDDEGNPVPALKLGLDLQGGMHLAVEVDESAAPPDADLDDAIERTVTTLRNRIDQFGVEEPNIQRAGDRIIVELAGVTDPERAIAIVNRTAHMEFKIVTDGQSFVDRLESIDRAIVAAVGPEGLTPTPLETNVNLGEVLGAAADTSGAGADTGASRPPRTPPRSRGTPPRPTRWGSPPPSSGRSARCSRRGGSRASTGSPRRTSRR